MDLARDARGRATDATYARRQAALSEAEERRARGDGRGGERPGARRVREGQRGERAPGEGEAQIRVDERRLERVADDEHCADEDEREQPGADERERSDPQSDRPGEGDGAERGQDA